MYNYPARQEGMMNPLILLRVHKIVLCISILKKENISKCYHAPETAN